LLCLHFILIISYLQNLRKLCLCLDAMFSVESGRLSDRYRIGTDTGHIVLNCIGYFCIRRYIAAGSAAVNWSHYTGDQRTVATCHPLRANAIDRPRYGRGMKGAGVRMLTATQQPLIRPTCHTPALQPMHQTTADCRARLIRASLLSPVTSCNFSTLLELR